MTQRIPGSFLPLALLAAPSLTQAAPCAEDFRKVRIDTDGEGASVAFDYTFSEKGEVLGWGREMWQRVRTEAGWKIVSVLYSVRDPQA